MNRKEIRLQVYIILDTLIGNAIDIKDDSDLELDLMVDSLDRSEIFLEIEKVFCINFNKEEIQNISTVNDIITAIDVRINHQ